MFTFWSLSVFFALAITLFVLGVIEKARNLRDVKRLKVRVNVNGIRGKSTATRLITSIMHEAGYKTVGKTTGSAARFIMPAEGTETEIVRRPEGPNIREQIKTIRKAADYGAEALVCECMAVRPEYQDVYQNKMFMADIVVIVNVLEDHLDVMGPTLDEIALAFSRSVPYNGSLIITPGPYADYFASIARERNSMVFYSDSSEIPEGYLERFEYSLFPENVAIGLAFAKAMGISRQTALEGMLKAAPDPGALRVAHLDSKTWNGSVFVNGFAANEPESSLKIYEMIQNMEDLPQGSTVVLFNGRPDRIDRTQQFIRDFFPQLNNVKLVGMGQGIKLIHKSYKRGRFPGVSEYIHLEDQPAAKISDRLKKMLHQSVLFGIGNIHGDAEDVIKDLLDKQQTPLEGPGAGMVGTALEGQGAAAAGAGAAPLALGAPVAFFIDGQRS